MQILLQATFGRPYIDVFETDNGDKDEATSFNQGAHTSAHPYVTSPSVLE